MLPLLPVIVLGSALLSLEAGASAWRGRPRYDLRDTAANLAMAAGGLLAGLPARALALGLSMLVYEHRVLEIPSAPWAWALLIVAEDFCYYCFHRAGHVVPVLWAAHVPHHTSTRFNLSTGLRASWTTPLTGIVFWLPLPWLGFHPAWVLAAHGVSLAYQFLLHTECVGRLGALEWVLNTPSHHRVHHARNPEYIDRNFGGILIIWDRLLGTFAAEVRPPQYGTVHPVHSHHPVVIAFEGWVSLCRAVSRPGLGWTQRVRMLWSRSDAGGGRDLGETGHGMGEPVAGGQSRHDLVAGHQRDPAVGLAAQASGGRRRQGGIGREPDRQSLAA
jgi:sterol desaturase/sphingolipid hydroxylase (fatty acid hydroxylase superfamily)